MEPFADLPDALVRDLLAKAVPVATAVSRDVEQLCGQREALRAGALREGLIRRKADLDVPREPSTVGVDGSYQIHRLTALDLSAAAAVAVEGTSRQEGRIWPEPYHELWVDGVGHCVSTTGVLRGLMVAMETSLAGKAPHDVVLLDGSFASLVIYLNNALTSLAGAPAAIAQAFWDRWANGLLGAIVGLMSGDRVLAVPKFTARTELTAGLPDRPSVEVDAKTLATLLLEPGEYTRPLPVLQPMEEYHLAEKVRLGGLTLSAYRPEEMESLRHAMADLRVTYFRPFSWIPAVRLELPGSVANSGNRMAIALEGIQRQFFSPAVLEPYPLFIADRMVKSLGSGVAVVEQAVAQQVADGARDIETSMLFIHNHRTEGGRGGT